MENLTQIAKLSNGYSKSELEATIKYPDDLRDSCFRIMEENATSSTASELLTYRILSLIIVELRMLQAKRDQEGLK